MSILDRKMPNHKIPEHKLSEIESAYKTIIEDLFEGEEFVFGPVSAKQTVDHYGEDNLNFVIVYDGEYCGLDPRKTIKASVEMGDYLKQFDFHNIPTKAYIHKSEYPEWLRLSKLMPWEKWDE